mgnify:CR=1 FL=1
MDGEKILTMLKSWINDDAKAEEIYEKIFTNLFIVADFLFKSRIGIECKFRHLLF